MTLDLGPIKERAERATAGPWVFDRKATGGEASPSLFSNAKILGDLAPMPITTGTPFWTDSDFDFIAHARADIPALVAEVEALREKLRCLTLCGEPLQSWLDLYHDIGSTDAIRAALNTERLACNKWRALATEARPYVDTSPDWLERFDAEAKAKSA